MKLNRLDTHDRYQYFTSQSNDIGACCQDLINQRPFGDHAFYIFAHKRTLGMDERFRLWSSGQYKSFEEVPSATIVWQPRLTKPKAQENSMLFKGYPGTDNVKIIWIIPERELWQQYGKDKIGASEAISESIEDYKTNKEKLERREEDDLTDKQVNDIYNQIAREAKAKARKSEILTINNLK